MIIRKKRFFNKLPTVFVLGFFFLQKKPGCNQFIWISEVLQITKGNLINKIKEIKSEQLNTFRVMLQFNVYNHRKH